MPNAAAKAQATRKRATARPATRTRKAAAPAKPLKPEYRELAAAVMGFASDRALASEKLGVTGTITRELKGRRSGMATILKMDDGVRVTVTVAVRSR